jgi:putative ABC transport system permease protein
MDSVLQDLRHSLRSLRRSPGFAVAAILTLALGLGANTAIFSVVNGVLLRPLPFHDPNRLVVVWGDHPTIGRETASLPDFLDWRAGASSFEGLAALALTNYTVGGRSEAELVRGAMTTADFFRTIGATPALGRGFLAGEDTKGAPRVVILGYGYWQRQYGGRADAVGSQLSLGAEGPYTVVGVAPRNLRWKGDVDLWTPLPTDSSYPRRDDFLTVVGRLRAGTTVARAQGELAGVAKRLTERYPDSNTGWSVELVPLQEQLVGDARPALLVFMGAVALVLLIACANVANLTLARLTSRQRELTVRAALGASRGRLLRQVLAESVLLAILGGVLGLVLAMWGVQLLRLSPAGTIPRMEEVGLDLRVLLFSFLLSFLAGVGFGVVPGVRLMHSGLETGLKDGGRSIAGGIGIQGLRRGLVAAEVAIAFVLLIGAGLLIRSFTRLLDVNPGFRSENILTARVSLPRVKYADHTRRVALYQDLSDQIRPMTGVQAVGLVSAAPLGDGAPDNAFQIERALVTDPSVVQDAETYTATPGYFGVLGIPLVRGRIFTDADRAGGAPVAVISQEMARRYWKGADPIGSRITQGDPADSGAQWLTVVGIVGDVRHERLDEAPYPQLYVPMAQSPERRMVIAVRLAGDPMRLAAVLRRALAEIDPDVPLSDIRTMPERVAESTARPRISATLLALFAGTALLLALVGIHGVIAYGVAQRTREMGIRVALGAGPRQVIRLVMYEGLAPVLAGVVLGLAGAYAGSRLLQNMLFEVGASDTGTYLVVTSVILSVAVAASYWPARRATRVDPIVALRAD